MNESALKDRQLIVATDHMNRLVGEVKELTGNIKRGRGSTSLLNQKITQLEGIQNRVSVLSAESKMFGQWTSIGETLPSGKEPYLWLLLLIISILYLAKNS